MPGEEPRRPQGASDYAEALVEAEEAARRLLSRLLGGAAGRFTLILSLEYDEEGPRRLVLDIEASRARMDRSQLEEVIEAVAEEAARVFEEKAGVRVGRRVRRRSSRPGQGRGGSS